MKIRSIVCALAFSSLVFGCGSEDTSETNADDLKQTLKESKEHLFSKQQEAIEKAKEVQKQMDEYGENLKDRINQATE